MSFKITAHTMAEVRSDLGSHADVLDGILLQHEVAAGISEIAERPWVQLAYREIGDDQLETVLAYAGLTKVGSPIGLPCEIEPIHLPPDFLLFSTQHLRRFIAEHFGPLLEERRSFADLDAFLESRELTVVEYLASAVVECASWCESRGHSMTIRW